SEDMLTNGLEFETELEKFLDSEKLFKFKSQLKRKRFFNKLKHFGSATLNLIISFFPFLYKKLKRFIKKVWRKYFSLKPATHDHKHADNEKI
ncbi:MAG: hypothetical protein KAS58_01900, partial [Calditrichia bacterium]|nr:hypothetical protein [Calditrichia bacterium]